LSLLTRILRHGFFGLLRLIPVNVRYYTPEPVKRYLKTAAGKLVPGFYDYFWLRRNPRERAALDAFINAAPPGKLEERKAIVKSVAKVHRSVGCGHLQEEMLEVISQILDFRNDIDGVVVEAGTYLGASAAKFSWACAHRGRRLVIFDSFEGLPNHDEPHDHTIFGEEAKFNQGDYKGSLDTVEKNIRRYGRFGNCEFVKGWYEDTMPTFDRSVIVAYTDVDLANSTRTCLKYLFPRLVRGGVIFSQDGHLPLVIDVMADANFWREAVGVEPPRIIGLGSRKLVQIWKD
jgi:O-methyltransferase